jgi:chemotaxis protein MotB
VRNPKYLETGGRTDRWMISYVDIMTILLILFAALAAQAVEAGKTVEPVPPRPTQAAAVQETMPPALMRAKQELLARGLELRVEERGLVISLPQAVLYPPGHDEVAEGALPVVAGIAEVLNAVPNKVVLIGHADASPIHSRRFRNNWELSAARSLRLLELLTERYGIPEERLSTAGHGEYSPRSSNDTKDGRAANRRVEILIVNQEHAQSAYQKPSPVGRVYAVSE